LQGEQEPRPQPGSIDELASSPAITRAVALAQEIVAITWLCELTVRTDAGLRVHAPKQTVIARRHGMVALGIYEKTFPTKRRAQLRMAGVKP
jgi:hypothetical protein